MFIDNGGVFFYLSNGSLFCNVKIYVYRLWQYLHNFFIKNFLETFFIYYYILVLNPRNARERFTY